MHEQAGGRFCCLARASAYEDWLALGRDLIARGLGAPMLIVADGAPGLVKAIEQCWPASDRQRCCVHRARNLYAKLPERERERVKQAYWQALETRSTTATPSGDDASPTIWTRSWSTCAAHPATATGGAAPNLLECLLGELKRADEGHGSLLRRGQLPHPRLGRPRPPHHPPDQRHPLQPTRPSTPQPDAAVRGAANNQPGEEVTAA